MRRSKIVCTIGPASNSGKTIAALIRGGMNAARLNFSHGDYSSHREAFSLVRKESARQKKTVSIIQDLQGIKIRIGDVEGGGVVLGEGSDIFLCPGGGVSSSARLFISYPALVKDVKEGETVLLDDGLIKLRVTGKTRDALRAKVLEGGPLKPKKGVNLPSSKISLRTFTGKDRRDLEFGLGLGVDYVAVSFVRSAEDIEAVLRWGRRKKVSLPPLIAKIEKPEALGHIEEILQVADGIMVARGDLGVEMPTAEVPVIQKVLIDLANRKGKPVITATQMLESMTQHTRPTRAEASDVANAVLDGTDALMLSAETASGRYPVEAVRMMDTIIRYTEGAGDFPSGEGFEWMGDAQFDSRCRSTYELGNSFPEAIADGACKAAYDVGARAIVVFTGKGFTARLISKLRPEMPVIAFTPNEETLRRMALYWGVNGSLIRRKDLRMLGPGFMTHIEKSLLKEGLAKKGDSIVFAASSPFLGKPNIIRLHKL